MGDRYRFGEFSYDAREARLIRGDVELELQPKLHDALRLFLERRGELIGKDELLSALWPRAEVNEEALTQTIKKLRRTLDDDAQNPRFLQTVMKRGYRFLADAPGSTQVPPSPALQPPRAAYDPRWYVSRPDEEQRARACLAVPGMPLVLLAPERMGKTWMLRHLLHEARGRGAKVVALNLELFDGPAWTSLEACLHELGRQLAAGLEVDEAAVDRAFARSRNPKANLNWLLERELLPRIEGELIVAIDRADAVWDRPFRDELFGLLRAWAENGAAEEHWPALRLALAISTSPALLIADPSQSPFNLSEPVRLGDLPAAQIADLAALHGLHPKAEALAAVRALVGGHPYLSRVIFHAAAQRGVPIEEIVAGRHEAFADYLDHMRARLDRQPGLQTALRGVAQGQAAPPDHARRLLAAGLVARDERTGAMRLRHELYAALL